MPLSRRVCRLTSEIGQRLDVVVVDADFLLIELCVTGASLSAGLK